MSLRVMPSLIERYELKYIIPASQVPSIRAFAEVYCKLDHFSEQSSDGYYRVNSLYFDTPDFLFLRNRLAREDNRFNMRLRCYGDSLGNPFFLEIKQKPKGVVRKYRARFDRGDWAEAIDMEKGRDLEQPSQRDRRNAELFRKTVMTYNAAPVVMTSYRRMAFFSVCDEYARLTFDRDLSFMRQRELNLKIPASQHAPSDAETHFDSEGDVILELKCHTTQVPYWMLDMIRAFNLQRRGFSKYSAALAQEYGISKQDASDRLSPLCEWNRSHEG